MPSKPFSSSSLGTLQMLDQDLREHLQPALIVRMTLSYRASRAFGVSEKTSIASVASSL
jgi:hypothetical protein